MGTLELNKVLGQFCYLKYGSDVRLKEFAPELQNFIQNLRTGLKE